MLKKSMHSQFNDTKVLKGSEVKPPGILLNPFVPVKEEQGVSAPPVTAIHGIKLRPIKQWQIGGCKQSIHIQFKMKGAVEVRGMAKVEF